MLLALALSALVIVIAQWLFPSPHPTRPGGTADTASSHVAPSPSELAPGAATSDTGAHAQQPTALAQVKPSANQGAGAAKAPGGAAPAGAPSTAPETLPVSTAHAVYRFSNVGASLVSVKMRDYPSRAPGARGEAELVEPGQPLLRYHVILGRDTLPLDRTVFQGSATRAADGSPLVTFHATVGGSTSAVIRYAISPDGYVSHVQGTISSTQTSTTPTEAQGPAYLLIDLPTGLASFEADTLDDQRHLAYAVKPARGDATSTLFSKLDPGEQKLQPGPISWAAAKDKYFLVGLLAADTSSSHQFAEVDMTGGPRTSNLASRAAATAVLPLGGGTGERSFAFDLYAGPQEWRRLRAIGRDFEDVNPYGGFLHPLLQPFATLVMQTILWMRAELKLNYGWVLIIFGVVVRFALWPLNQRAMKTSLKMQAIQPELAVVQKRYANDQTKLQAEMMRVYREHGMSPFSPIAGCLPMLLPMPIFFTLLFVFQNTIEFRGVPFLWLHDISVKDPYYILPLIMGASAFVLSWIGLRNSPPNPQAKMMGYMFPLMMTVLLANVAAGLNLYYAVQNIAALPQQWLLARARKKA